VVGNACERAVGAGADEAADEAVDEAARKRCLPLAADDNSCSNAPDPLDPSTCEDLR
jgi:hypothetical protein